MLYFEDLQIGASQVMGPYELRAEEMIAFAKTWDPQPFHTDPEAAALTVMQGLTASSSYTFAVFCRLSNQGVATAYIGSVKWESELPAAARPGDLLTLTITNREKRVSASKPDRGLLTVDAVLANQHGTVVMRLRSLYLVRCRPTAA